MKICDLYKPGKTVLSFEIFPPKKDGDIESVYSTIKSLSALAPDFVSVTFGAASSFGTLKLTADIAERIKQNGVEPLAHLTCSGVENGSWKGLGIRGQGLGTAESYIFMERSDAITPLSALKRRGIENILALRGDEVSKGGFRYAKDLIAAVKGHGFCIGGAAYPEGHISCESLQDDIRHLKQKEDAGASFFITQLFFENDIFAIIFALRHLF